MTELIDRLQSALRGTYRLERELGGGGMSRVFLAEENELSRKVVIKVLPPELGAGISVDRFRREIQLAARLQHPHIVPLLSAGHADDLLYYTMPFIEGESLRARIARAGELPIGEALRMLRDVSDALVCAHEQGVVHRDIKPDNILLTHSHAVVTDFGVAKALSEASGETSLTSTGIALGTPAYMAPEQAVADRHADHRVDIYALGAVGYEMLTGRPPFTAITAQAVLAAHLTKEPEVITKTRAAVPAALAALVMRCLEKNPADRWQSSAEVLHQIEAMATPSGGTPPLTSIAPPREPIAPPSRGWARRVGIGVVVGLAVLGAAFGLMKGNRREASQVAPADRKKLVVLPFANLGRADEEYFADGLTEEITSRLAAVQGLGVISRTSAIQYKSTTRNIRQIGEELGVDYVLEGTVRWEKPAAGPSRVRVTPQLIKVSDDSHVWADRYDAVLSEVFQVQSTIAEQVINALGVALLEPARAALEVKPTKNLEAYDNYLRGNKYFQTYTEEDLRTAERFYQKAVDLDTSFALAYARLSQTHDALHWFGHDRTRERREQARQTAERALQLEPQLPEAHLALGMHYYHGALDYQRALNEFDLARARQPNNSDVLAAIGYVQRRQGKWEEAEASVSEALQLDPRAASVNLEQGITKGLLRKYDEADKYLQRAIDLSPDEPHAYGRKAQFQLNANGDTLKARQTIAVAITRMGMERVAPFLAGFWMTDLLFLDRDSAYQAQLGSITARSFGSDAAPYHWFKARWHRDRGDLKASRADLDSAAAILERDLQKAAEEWRPGPLHSRLGLVYARLGRKSEAIRVGMRGAELLPVSKDAFFGVDRHIALAEIYAQVNEPDRAIAELEYALSVPSWISKQGVRVDPDWDPIRHHPRFKKLVE